MKSYSDKELARIVELGEKITALKHKASAYRFDLCLAEGQIQDAETELRLVLNQELIDPREEYTEADDVPQYSRHHSLGIGHHIN